MEREVSLEGRGHPYLLDAWSGRITPIVKYTASADRVTVRLRLSKDNGAVIALSEDRNRFGGSPVTHVTRTDAADAVLKRDDVVIRASTAGTYNTTLANGRSVRSVIGSVPFPVDLTKAVWHLVAEDWQPAHPYATTFGPQAAETQRTRIELDLQGLKAWHEIPPLQNSAGTATYTTSFDLPSTWTAANGARLSLGEVFDSFTLTINGKSVPVDQLSAECDAGPYLQAGRNTLAVRVATTLNNRLAKIDEAVATRGMMQPYGLVGPVVLTPYAESIVWRKAGR